MGISDLPKDMTWRLPEVGEGERRWQSDDWEDVREEILFQPEKPGWWLPALIRNIHILFYSTPYRGRIYMWKFCLFTIFLP